MIRCLEADHLTDVAVVEEHSTHWTHLGAVAAVPDSIFVAERPSQHH